eukprot:scaffold306882_cov30-Tisochrysis_lutea.AAC.1
MPDERCGLSSTGFEWSSNQVYEQPFRPGKRSSHTRIFGLTTMRLDLSRYTTWAGLCSDGPMYSSSSPLSAKWRSPTRRGMGRVAEHRHPKA